MAYVDLAELAAGSLDRWPVFSSRTPFALTSLLSRDHLVNEPGEELDAGVRALVHGATGVWPTGPVRLLTNLRILGVEFNPVSFYYVFEGEEVAHVVAEVSNFPWFEQHTYVLSRAPGECRFEGCEKAFHVSPFMGMDLRYEWIVRTPAERLGVCISLVKQGDSFFTATLDASRRPFSAAGILWMQITHPMQTVRIMVAILYEAVKLFRRGLRFFPHPDGAETAASRAVEAVVRAVNCARTAVAAFRTRALHTA